MFGLWKRKHIPSRDALLSSIPIKNELVKESWQGNGKSLGATMLRLKAPLAGGRLRAIFARPEKGNVAQKAFELDALGASVWQAMDGTRSVEAVIRYFSEQQRVNLREAEVAVLAFLKTLAQRNLIALVVHRSAPAPSRKRKGKRARL